MKKMLEKIKEAGSAEPDKSIVELSDVLFDAALLNSGFLIDDTNGFFDKMEKIIRKGFKVPDTEAIQEPYVEVADQGIYLKK